MLVIIILEHTKQQCDFIIHMYLSIYIICAFIFHYTGLRILNSYDVITDLQEAQALSHKNGHIEIYSNSWGPVDDGEEVGGPGALLQRALETAATEVNPYTVKTFGLFQPTYGCLSCNHLLM